MQAVNIQTIQAGGSGFRHLLWYADTAYISGQIGVVKYVRQG
jgi:enamine deaminase RidA (YjgF/YER057c/UK114 family)